GWHHRIGLGKPLGFGSSTIQVERLEILNANERYSGLAGTGWSDGLDNKQVWKDAFKRAMRERYGAEFERLENVRDLRALLSETPPLPVHYPRPTREPHPDGKNYE